MTKVDFMCGAPAHHELLGVRYREILSAVDGNNLVSGSDAATLVRAAAGREPVHKELARGQLKAHTK